MLYIQMHKVQRLVNVNISMIHQEDINDKKEELNNCNVRYDGLLNLNNM
jgi:hypothetical protein